MKNATLLSTCPPVDPDGLSPEPEYCVVTGRVLPRNAQALLSAFQISFREQQFRSRPSQKGLELGFAETRHPLVVAVKQDTRFIEPPGDHIGIRQQCGEECLPVFEAGHRPQPGALFHLRNPRRRFRRA